MWRARFYEESWIGRRVYTPFVGLGCAAYVVVLGYQHAKDGQPFLPYLSMMLPGFGLFLGAKVSMLRKRIWVSFGTEHMSAAATAQYLAGYTLMVLGFVLGFGCI